MIATHVCRHNLQSGIKSRRSTSQLKARSSEATLGNCVILLLAVEAISDHCLLISISRATHKVKTTVSRGWAETRLGVKVTLPPDPPTTTLMMFPVKDAGVGAGEFGYEEYVVVQIDS